MKSKIKNFFLLHALFFIYSLAGVFSKLAAGEKFLSITFMMLYGAMLSILLFYAIMWQQILKRMALVTAYVNKAVTVLWGLIWGTLFFDENITVGKVLGSVTIIYGIYLITAGEVDE